MCDIVFNRKATASRETAAASPAPAAASAPPTTAAQRVASSSRRRRTAPGAGFTVAFTSAADDSGGNASEINPKADELADLSYLDGHEVMDSPEMRDYLKTRLGNEAANVLAVLRLWQSYGEVFSAWRMEWEEDTTEYR
eukprot:6174874-Pleurochrysis_carterae.AAC.1